MSYSAEAFLANTFDLSNTSVVFVPTAGSYTVAQGGTPPSRDPITISSSLMPNIVTTFAIDINDTPSASIWNGVVFGTTAIGPIALPGASSCSIYTSADIIVLGGPGVTTVPVAIPSNVSLSGALLET